MTLISTLPVIKSAHDTFMFEVTKQTLFWGKALFVTLINRESSFIVFPQQLWREDWEVCLPNCLLENPFVNLHNAGTDSYHNDQNNPKCFKMSFELHFN